MKQFVGGFALATLIVGGGAAWVIKPVDDQQARWPLPAYYDPGSVVPESGYVRVSGSLLGEDMDGSTFLDVTCDGDSKICRVTELQQFGRTRNVTLWSDEYAITSWSAGQVVAESSPPKTACNHLRMVIDRVAKVTHYYRIPNPGADSKNCNALYSKKKVFDWTLGEQPI